MRAVFLKRAEVLKMTGLGYTTVYRMEKAGKFPARKQLSAGRVGWLHSEVERWVNSRASVHGESIALELSQM
ncbi:AlpA family phage regulatory protein [Desulfuromonas sp. TF]|uniref:helix-turn-helix transcriptional regulator n=1 Tax=Desulfuromonas sp. TF TaxID=1232410 RepID=UPI000486C9F5